MMNSTNQDNLNHYSGGLWRELQAETEQIRNQRGRGLNEPEKHEQANRLHQLVGSFQTADRLIPRIVDEHRKSVLWAMERILNAVEIGGRMYFDDSQRERLSARVHEALGKIDAGEYVKAEAQLREIESELESLRMYALDQQVEKLLSCVEAYTPQSSTR
jgi:hypothetical protein